MHRALATLALALCLCAGARADPVADFYRGRSINWILSAGAGGGYASYAQAFAPYFAAHIPGNPNIVIQNMPGGGGIRAMLYLNAVAPKDGTTLGLVHSSVPFAPLYGIKAAAFDPRRMNWIGSIDASTGICVAWHGSGIATWADMLKKPFTVGSTGAGSQMETMPIMLDNLFGTKIKVIAGYKDGVAVYIAMERGELDGRCGGQLTVIKSTRPHWLTERKIQVPILIAQKRSPEFPDTPTVMEFVKDEPTRQQLDLVMLTQGLDRPVMLPPGVPAERVRELRAAFDATMADPAFRADIERRSLHVDPVRGEEMAKAFERAFALPPEVIAGAREMMAGR